jgi:DNA-binding winged helix-turn-helix (wHTH) protein
MVAPIQTRSVLRFGAFEVDLSSGELRHRGVKLKVQEQPFRVLAALLEQPGEVVTREQLRARLWSSDTFVDFEHSLNASIKKLRQALRVVGYHFRSGNWHRPLIASDKAIQQQLIRGSLLRSSGSPS